jgi:hypothetical protein
VGFAPAAAYFYWRINTGGGVLLRSVAIDFQSGHMCKLSCLVNRHWFVAARLLPLVCRRCSVAAGLLSSIKF